MMSGTMQMPESFKYRDVYLKGRPVHDKFSRFYAKHPPMPSGRWAKIFSPFDALKGFGDAVSSKEILYEYKRTPDEDIQNDLNRKTLLLQRLVRDSRKAGSGSIQASVTYYLPCTDQNSEACGYKGLYAKKTGIVQRVDIETDHSIRIDRTVIRMDDIIEINIKEPGEF